MKRVFASIFIGLFLFACTYYGMLEYGESAMLFECESGTYDHESQSFESDREGAILCNFAQIEAIELGDYDIDMYEPTFFGKIARILIIFLLPGLLGLFIGVSIT